jgi:hypothetical protein
MSVAVLSRITRTQSAVARRKWEERKGREGQLLSIKTSPHTSQAPGEADAPIILPLIL